MDWLNNPTPHTYVWPEARYADRFRYEHFPTLLPRFAYRRRNNNHGGCPRGRAHHAHRASEAETFAGRIFVSQRAHARLADALEEGRPHGPDGLHRFLRGAATRRNRANELLLPEPRFA